MASKKIKGITIQYEGDTVKLEKALANVESGGRKVKAEMSEVNRALKEAPNSAVLWQQKQELLNKTLESSKEKLKLLEDAQEQVTRQFEKGDIGEEQYRAFERELEKARADTEKLGEQVTDTEKHINELGGEAEKTSGDLDKIGNTAESSSEGFTVLKGAVAQLAADGFEKLMTSAKEAWEEIDEGYDTIIKKTGATGQSLEELQSVADSVFGALPVEMSDTGAAVGEINTRFAATGDELESLTAYFLKYAEVNDTQVAGSVRNVAGIMKAFQENTKNTTSVLDVLTDVGQRTGKDLNSLESELLSNSATFKELGLDIRQSAELLGQFEANGIDTSTALAGLKKAQQEATAEGKTMTDALGDTMKRIKGAKDETEALQIATDLFGKKGAAPMTQAIREQRFSLDDLTTGYTDMRNVVNDTYEATQDAPDKAKVALNNLKLELAQLGEAVLPKVEKVVDSGVKKLPAIKKTLKPIGDGIRNFVTAMKPAVEILGNGIKNIGTGAKWLIDKIPTLRRAAQEAKTQGYLSVLTSESKELSDGVEEDIKKMDELRSTAREQTEIDLAKTYKTETLYKELQGLVDQDGKVKKGYEDRVNFIIGELEQATGIEINQIDGVIQEYDKLQAKIEETIQKQRAEIFQKNYTEMYSEALAQNTQAASKLVQAQNIRDESQAYLSDLNSQVKAMFEQGGKMYGSNITYDMVGNVNASNIDQLKQWGVLSQEEYARAQSALINYTTASDTLAKEKAAIQQNNKIISQYEKAEQALANGNYSLAQGLFASIDEASIASFGGAKDNADELVKYYKDQIDEVGKKIKAATDNNIKNADSAIKAEITELVSKMTNDGLTGAELLKTGIIEKLSQIDGFDTTALKEFMTQTGVDLGDILATQTFAEMSSELRAAVTRLLYENNDLINEHSINSPGDVEVAMREKWFTNNATGTFMNIGQQGIVAEAGPELLQVMNGGVKVTPLNKTATNTPVGAGGDTIINHYNNYVSATVSNDYDVDRLAQRLATAEKRENIGKGR